MNFKIIGGNKNAQITLNEKKDGDILYLTVSLHMDDAQIPEPFTLAFNFSAKDVYSTWSPSLSDIHGLYFEWAKLQTKSRLASWMPLQQLISPSNKNKLCIAVSDVDTPIRIGTGIREEDATFACEIEFFTVPTSPVNDYTAVVRLDMRNVPYYDSIYDTSGWWEKDCGYTPAYVPEAARQPMDSLWYSFHQQLDREEILKECKASKALGMETVIIDDGWQTDDNNRGYAYCGDWEVAPKKMGDMASLVDEIHNIGMKVMLWYSVPFVGIHSQKYEEFKTMFLDKEEDGGNAFTLDPRYKKVRDYLTGVYTDAVKNRKLDGLKLDFIDSFWLDGKSLEYDARRDYQSLEDALHALMSQVKASLTAINPEILIEFRQSYVGPSIRKYGNMLRVGDCPCDILKNRVNVVKLRFTSGKTAVHSDMIMWNTDDTPENAALQFVSILYGVPQISMRTDKLPEAHYKMLKYYISFWKEWRDVLLDGKLTAENPESEYSIVSSVLGDKSVITAYTKNVVEVKTKNTVVVNGTAGESFIIKNAKNKQYKIVNCMGEEIRTGSFDADLCEINIPTAGMLFIK
ncbi:MAG: alpha-galactosidase [Clostridia bacterium]|nr:alpha-galactosidase [Clostridia bacterium]